MTPIKGSSQPSASQSNDQNSEVIEFNTNDASGNRIGGHSSTRDEKQQSNSNLLLNKTPNRHTPSRQSTTDNLSLTNSQLRTSIHTHNHTHTHIHTHTPTRLATSNRHPHLQSPETLNTESVDIFSHDNRSRRPSLGGIPSSGTIEFYNRAIGGLHVRTPEAKQTNNPVTPTWFTLSSDLEENEGEEILNDQSKFIYDDPLGSGPSLTQRPRRYSGNKDAKVSNDNFQMESMKKELDDLKKAWNETISENKALYQLVKKALAEKQALQFQLRSVATTHMLYDVAKQEIADLKSELAKHSSCGCSKLIDFLSPNSKGKKETGNNK